MRNNLSVAAAGAAAVMLVAVLATALWAADGTTQPAAGTTQPAAAQPAAAATTQPAAAQPAGNPPASTPAGETIVTPSGLTIIKVSPGEDAAKAGDTVFVHYEGRLQNGQKFDASRDHAETADNGIEFPLGQGKVIKGWDEGVEGMKIGEKRTLIVPPQLGYGARGAGGVIPPNATLTFDVQLVGILRRPPDAAQQQQEQPAQ